MAISTQGVQLKVYKAASEGVTAGYQKLVDIKSFPDMGAAPNLIECTSLSDDAQKFIEGVKTMTAMEFTANYDETDFNAVAALTGNQDYMLDFGDAGKFYWSGSHTAFIVGGGVNAVVDMKLTVVPTTAISTTAPTHA